MNRKIDDLIQALEALEREDCENFDVFDQWLAWIDIQHATESIQEPTELW